MSAIAGLVRSDGQPIAGPEVERMIASLTHRAPDGITTWGCDAIALAHGARWTTPEAARELQPLRVGACVITADARLDNRAELRATLGAGGHAGDAELILLAYERWGERCAAKLVGDFAFAIWDDRHRRLLGARDHVGVKPFYYHQSPTAFRFASEIKALLTSPSVPYGLNPVRVADYLVGLFDDRAATFYRDVYRLPPGHTVTVGRDGVQIRRYWSLEPIQELRLGSDEAYAEAFRETLTAAVQSRLRSRRPVGSLLSGGLDSSTIVAVARSLRAGEDGDLDTFTAVFPGLSEADLRRIDERGYVEALVAQGGLRSHVVRGDQLSPLGEVDRVLWHLDEAYAAPNLYLHWALYKAASDHGVGVLLDGIDGDTTVSHGLERLAGLARQGRVLALGHELRKLSGRHRIDARRLAWQFAVQPLIPFPVRQAVRRLRRREPVWQTPSMIRPEFARRTGVAERVESWERQQVVRSPRAAHRRAMESGLIPYVLELADKASAASGVEARYPFFDRRLMELCLSMPAEQKLQEGWSRSVMRRATKGLLPDQVRWRVSKANLSANFTAQFAENGPLLREVLERPEIIDEYVDISALRRAHDRYVTHRGPDDAVALHSAVVLALWLQRAKLAA